MTTITMQARPVAFEVKFGIEDARGFVRKAQEAYEGQVDGDGAAVHRVLDRPEGFEVNDGRIESVKILGVLESGFGTVGVVVRATSENEAVRYVGKRFDKLGIL